jgi:hypothetical protein
MNASIIWEIAKGITFPDRETYPQDTMYTEQEFNDLINGLQRGTDYIGIDYINRLTFLQENGYSITPENLVNSELPTVSQED